MGLHKTHITLKFFSYADTTRKCSSKKRATARGRLANLFPSDAVANVLFFVRRGKRTFFFLSDRQKRTRGSCEIRRNVLIRRRRDSEGYVVKEQTKKKKKKEEEEEEEEQKKKESEKRRRKEKTMAEL